MSSSEAAECHGIAAGTLAHCPNPAAVITATEPASAPLAAARRRHVQGLELVS